jgi:hypothetical protein
MDENLELEQDVDVDFEDTADVEEVEETEDIDESDEEETYDESDDEELEYDDDGNVVEAEEEPTNDTTAQVEERNTNTTDTKPVENPLQRKYDDREAIIKDALKSMGIDTDNVDEGLLQLAADAEGVSVEEYTKQRNEKRATEEAKRLYRQVMMEKMVQSDLNELHSLFPETKTVTRFENIPNCRRYAELRDKGLSVKEAYSAANADARREAIASSVKQQTINASKSHLKSNVPIASKDTSIKITRAEMEQMRDLFPNKSDKELVALYKKTK